MPVDPVIQGFIDQMAAGGGSPMSALSPTEARMQYELTAALGGPPAELAAAEDRTIPGPAGELPIRIYRPVGETPMPVCVHFHGGGFTIGSIASHDPVCRQLAAQSGAFVVSVEYRLAPEHPFPAAVDDAYAATCWVAEHAGEFGGDGARLAVAGDSAGGTLAAVTCIKARDLGGPPIAFQLLVYPAADLSASHPSITRNGEGLLLTADTMRWFMEQYKPDLASPYASPILADAAGLPPAMVITAEYDPLVDEGDAYAAHLRDAGVPVTHLRRDGMTHVFWQMHGLVEDARTTMKEAATALAATLGNS